MTNSYWHKQTEDALLYPDLAWSKPENKRYAGKLLVIGGNLHGFSAPAQAFTEAEKAGIGTCRVLLPDAIQKVVKTFIPEADYGPSTPSGSFAQKSLDTWLESAAWSDGILLAGDFGRNSETAIVLEKFIQKHSGALTITKDAVDYFSSNSTALLQRENTCLVVSFAQLQKLATNARFPQAFTFDMDFLRLVDALHELTSTYPVCIVTKHLETYFVAQNGRVSTTKMTKEVDIWRVKAAAHASVWWLQHPSKQFEAISTSIVG